MISPRFGACSCAACRGGGILGQPQAGRKRDTPTARRQLTRSRKDVLDCHGDDHPAERRESKSGRKIMFRSVAVAAIACAFAVAILSGGAEAQTAPQRPTVYFPERNNWQQKTPEDEGMDSARLNQAVQAAIAGENPLPKEMFQYLATTFGAHEPLATPIGPIKDRGPANGLITRHGYVVAEWGDPKRIDMTFSVTKTFLTTVVGLAWQRGLIRDVNEFARDYMPAGID